METKDVTKYAMVQKEHKRWCRVAVQMQEENGTTRWYPGLTTNTAEEMIRILTKNKFEILEWNEKIMETPKPNI